MPSTRRPDVPFWGPQLAALAAVLDDVDRAGALIVGGPGAGKTSLVRAVLQQRAGAAALTLQCSTALADVAYGALSPCLAELDDIRGPVDVLRAVHGILAALADPGSVDRPVIVVEDCQFLDAASAFVLAQLAQNRETVLLATSVGLRDGSGLNALVDTGLLATLAIPPLEPTQVRALCRALTGGRPTAGTVRTITAMTGGSPRLVTAFVASAGDQGIIVRSGPDPGAPWSLLRPAPSVDERLVDVVEGMHAELTDEQQTAVTMLALAGRLPRSQVRVVAGEQARDLAEAHATRAVDDGMVELASVLYGEVLRATTPPGHSSVLLSRWAAAGGTTLRPPPARSVLWALDNGLAVSVQDRVDAGYAHLAARDLTDAWSLATRPGELDTPDLALLRAEVMLESARTWSGRSALSEVADTVTDGPMVATVLAVLAVDLVRSGEQPSTVEALRQVWSQHLARTAGATALTGPAADWLTALDGVDDQAQALRLLELSAALLADGESPPALRCLAHELRERLLSREGQLVAAAEEASLAYAEATRTPRLAALLGGPAMVRSVMAHVVLGDLAAAECVLTAQRDVPVRRWHAWSGSVGALEGFVEILRGRPERAARCLRDAVLDLQQSDPEHLGPLAEALLALVTATPDATSTSVVERLHAGGCRGPVDRWLLALGIAGVADEISGLGISDATPRWRRVLADPELDAFPAVRRDVLFVAACSRGPDEDHDELLVQLYHACAGLDGPRSALIRQACDPEIAGDWVRLVGVADSLRAAGDLALAADVWARVVQVHDRTGDLRRRGEALRHLQDVVAALGGVPSRYVRAALDLGALTEREHEIVRLALAGKSNADIARTLVVSPRTVEGHLYRVFSKLGISDRAELRDIRLY